VGEKRTNIAIAAHTSAPQQQTQHKPARTGAGLPETWAVTATGSPVLRSASSTKRQHTPLEHCARVWSGVDSRQLLGQFPKYHLIFISRQFVFPTMELLQSTNLKVNFSTFNLLH